MKKTPKEAYPNHEFKEDSPLEKFFWDISYQWESIASYIAWGDEPHKRFAIQTLDDLRGRHEKAVKRFNSELQ